MSSYGGEIKFKTDFPKSKMGTQNAEFVDETLINPNAVTITPEEVQNQLNAFRFQ